MICTDCTSYLWMLAWKLSNKTETHCHNKIILFIYCWVLTVTLQHFVLLSNSSSSHHRVVQGSPRVAPLINLDTWRRSVNSFTPLPLYLRGNSPRYPLNTIGGPPSPIWKLWRKYKGLIVVGNQTTIPRTFSPQPHSSWWTWLPLPQEQFRNYPKFSHNAMKVRKPDSIRLDIPTALRLVGIGALLKSRQFYHIGVVRCP